LLQEYDAVFVAVGAGSPTFLGIPGEQLVGVSSANEFLTRVNLMQGYRNGAATPVPDLVGRPAMVIGGGNTAFDAARSALRLGASEAILAYRRSEEEMPARVEEINHAREEGVRLELWTSPVEFLGDGEGRLRGVRVVRTEPGPPEADGRRRPVPVPGSERELPIEVAIVAVGNSPNQLLARSDPGLRLTAKGTIEIDPATGAASRPGVYAGGDIVTGAATVTEAMGAGRLAAASIDEYLRKGAGEGEGSD
jgi:glutamate synthase (NADPH) small chain